MKAYQPRPTRNQIRDENGITALETAIILIAFVIGAAVFAFAILSAGMNSTQRGKEAVLSGLNEVQSAIEIQGQIVAIASSTGPTGTIDSLVFTLANTINGNPIPMAAPGSGNNMITIDYYDEGQRISNLNWMVTWLLGDDDALLENQELAEITITNLGTQLTNPLSANNHFTLEIKPSQGNTLTLARTTPPHIEQVNTLD